MRSRSRWSRFHNTLKKLGKTILVCLLVATSVWYITMSTVQPDPCATVERTNPLRVSNSDLPKTIHQQWKNEDLPPLFHRMRQNVMRVFPESEGFNHVLWNDESAARMIAESYPEWYDMYESIPRAISKADVARCFILHKYGGLYLDADYEPLENFWTRLPDDGPALVESPWTRWPYAGERHQNSLMSSPPGDEFWNVTFSLVDAAMKKIKDARFVGAGTANRDVLGIAGPKMIDAAIDSYGGTTYSLSCNNWHRMVYPAYKQWYRKIEHAFAFTTFGTKMCGWPNAGCHYGIHHGTASWN